MRLRSLWSVVAMVLAIGACSSSGPSDTAASTTTVAVTTTVSSGGGGAELTLTSSAFSDGGSIPARFACAQAGGDGDSPPLAWSHVPVGTKTLVLVVHDPDAPIAGGFTHLVTVLPTGTTSVTAAANKAGSGPMEAWTPMCPPSGTHHYRFTLYAFPTDVAVADGATKAAIDVLAPHATTSVTLTGVFAKPLPG